MWVLQTAGFTADLVLFVWYKKMLGSILAIFTNANLDGRAVLKQTGALFFISFLRSFIKIQADFPFVNNVNRVETIVYGMYFHKLTTIDLQTTTRIEAGTVQNGITSDLARLVRAAGLSHQLVATAVSLTITATLIVQKWVEKASSASVFSCLSLFCNKA